ncbi:hypothetical protein [Streptomyces sp. NPDC048637]|uniref:hypothetical protein n=1 Tax=Streptomyces sp. NPDC048637 TaxID=3155636 RepID=UPI0034429EAE
MPGQRKRKRRQQELQQRTATRFAADAGRWEVLVETQDQSELRAHMRRLRAEPEQIDWSMTRVDTLCGRLVEPTTHRLSVFVPATAAVSAEDNERTTRQP